MDKQTRHTIYTSKEERDQAIDQQISQKRDLLAANQDVAKSLDKELKKLLAEKRHYEKQLTEVLQQ